MALLLHYDAAVNDEEASIRPPDDPTSEPSDDATPEPPEDEEGEAQTPRRECPAGQNCEGKYEHEEPIYKGMDFFLMAIGISSRPVPIQRKCALCQHVWEITEPRVW